MKTFEFEDFRLSLIQNDDLNETLKWRNHPSSRYFFISTHIISKSEHLSWFFSYKYRESKNRDFVYIIKDSDGIKYGQVSLYNIDFHKKICFIGRFLSNPDHRSKGIMQKSFCFCLKLAKSIGIYKIQLETHKENRIAIHIFSKFGFSKTGMINKNFIKMEINV